MWQDMFALNLPVHESASTCATHNDSTRSRFVDNYSYLKFEKGELTICVVYEKIIHCCSLIKNTLIRIRGSRTSKFLNEGETLSARVSFLNIEFGARGTKNKSNFVPAESAKAH